MAAGRLTRPRYLSDHNLLSIAVKCLYSDDVDFFSEMSYRKDALASRQLQSGPDLGKCRRPNNSYHNFEKCDGKLVLGGRDATL